MPGLGCCRDLAEQTTLTGQLSSGLCGLARRRTRHDPGRVLTDLAVAIADGAECISDIATLVDQPGLFGPVASDSTVWRLLEHLDAANLARVATRSGGGPRDRLGPTGRGDRCSRSRRRSAAGRTVQELRIDLDASVVIAHSEKEQATPTFKGTFGFHPMLATLDNTGEFLAAHAAPGQRRREQRRRPHRRARRGAGADPGPASVRDTDPGPGRHRRRHEGVPGPHRRAACAGHGAGLLRRLAPGPAGQRDARRDRRATRVGLGPGHRHRQRARRACRRARADRAAAVDQSASAGRLPARDADHRAPRTPPPRRPAGPVRGFDRLALHRIRDHQPGRATRLRSTPDIEPTPGSRTESAARRTPACAGSRPATTRSTRPGWPRS